MKTESRSSHKASAVVIPVLVVLTMLACNLATPTPSNSSPTPAASGDPPAAPECVTGIRPGSTTKAEVFSLLGEPARTDDSTGNEVLIYASSIKGQFNSLVFQDEKVAMVSVILDENDLQKWSDILEEVGQPAQTTYSYYLQDAMIYIFPEKGLAIVADEAMNVAFIKQCYVPMSLAEYMNSWGKSLPTEDPYTY